jgi:alkylation response protein AidB-like acyl-CoA dehydrogenase
MDFPLQAVSAAGRKFVRLCETHEQAFFSRADENDRAGAFPNKNIEDAIKSGAIAATVPAELGGIGVVSLRDHAAGMTRLGPR